MATRGDETNSEAEKQPFRLLDLPPELRNSIVCFTLVDNAPHQLDLLNAKAEVPLAAITAVSRQLRSETYELYQEALETFWKAHDFDVVLDAAYLDAGKRKALLSYCNGLAPFGIKRLECRYVQLVRKGTLRTMHQAVILDSHGVLLEKRWWSPGEDLPPANKRLSEATAYNGLVLSVYATELGGSLSSSGYGGGLDVEMWARVVFRWVDRHDRTLRELWPGKAVYGSVPSLVRSGGA
ncbi:hypothetical protein LTR36_010399 [Oleoguttula mirabilis]|uniref:F-box domain-containing protein n=1 Tax=Oleoguttula mirabilis TaxID=1507867 RepID=A0AAV9J5X8_9PEZI|nr:hypothetical protein LTR36_010399 [Oleoguttula mirabilis]